MRIDTLLLTDVVEHLQAYADNGLHYHLAAVGIYTAREEIGDLFSDAFRPYIIAGLLAYDMARQLGKSPYRSFAMRLRHKLDIVRPLLTPFMRSSLADLTIADARTAIAQAYNVLAAKGSDGLPADPTRSFYVGASKILHWLNPDLFLIIDSHIATAFHHHPDPNARITLLKARTPCYSAEAYLQCLSCAQREIRTYGVDRLRREGNGLPLANLYGNVAFQIALGSSQQRTVKETE